LQHSSRRRRQSFWIECSFERSERAREIERALARRGIEIVPRGVIAKLVEGVWAMCTCDLFDE
jgi:hypothetical protein